LSQSGKGKESENYKARNNNGKDSLHNPSCHEASTKTNQNDKKIGRDGQTNFPTLSTILVEKQQKK